MIQQYHFWAYICRNVSEDTIQTLASPCLLQYYSQQSSCMETAKMPHTDEWIKKM
jgi:hypothetical protein